MFITIEKNVGNIIRANLQKQMVLNEETQASIGQKIGVSQSTISRYMESAEKMTFAQLMRIANAIGCNYRDFLEGIF